MSYHTGLTYDTTGFASSSTVHHVQTGILESYPMIFGLDKIGDYEMIFKVMWLLPP